MVLSVPGFSLDSGTPAVSVHGVYPKKQANNKFPCLARGATALMQGNDIVDYKIASESISLFWRQIGMVL